MASQKFKTEYRKKAQQENILENPKVMVKESEISEERRSLLIDWITFYRRNMHRFVQHYFGIKLYAFQIIWLYIMSKSDTFVSICSRGTSKTWLLAVLACAKAVLYPNSEIVVVSSTKEQAGTIVSDKISSLYTDYPNLAREISNITTNMNKWQVDFHNGSVIRVVASRDSSRGKRATFIVYEEFPRIDKIVIDSIIRHFAYVRQTPYLHDDRYKHLKEEPKEVFISSAYHKGLWWYEETKKTIKAMLKGDNSGFIAMDISVALNNNIKTKRQIKDEISKSDQISVLEEIWNIPYGESSNAYFRLKMFNKSRKISKAFYPQRMQTYNGKRNPYFIPKVDGEIRLISSDIAMRANRSNDLSISSCVRLLPTHRGYFRELPFIESFRGENSITQSIRLKQLYYDFEADIIVLDVQNAGIAVFDQLGVLTADVERGLEYPPMTIMNHESIDFKTYEELSERTLGINAMPVIYPISATSKLNSEIAVLLRDKLQKKMWSFLLDEASAEDYLIKSSYSKEFLNQEDLSANSFFLSPYIQTSLLINECVGLSMSLLSGNIKLVEPAGGLKDRFVSLAYANFYASLLDQTLLKENDNEDDFDYIRELVQTT